MVYKGRNMLIVEILENLGNQTYNVDPQTIAKLLNITPISMVYGSYKCYNCS